MKIRQVMTKSVKTCSPNDDLNVAADVMWKNDCGCVPILDADAKVVGMLTDRDIAMAAYTQGRPLAQIPVPTAMATHVLVCRADDEIDVAERLMRENQIRRLPVVDAEGHLNGIVSLNDIARLAADPENMDTPFVRTLASTMAFVCRPRHEPATA